MSAAPRPPADSEIVGRANREGARLFPVGDADGLSRAIARALDDPVWANTARERNRLRVAERGDLERNLGRIEGLFRELIDRRRQAGS